MSTAVRRLGPSLALVSLLALVAVPSQASGQKQDKLRKALNDDVSSAWIYDDIQAGYETARKTGKPLLVAFR
jgi:hypothetical protein